MKRSYLFWLFVLIFLLLINVAESLFFRFSKDPRVNDKVLYADRQWIAIRQLMPVGIFLVI